VVTRFENYILRKTRLKLYIQFILLVANVATFSVVRPDKSQATFVFLNATLRFVIDKCND